MNRYQEAGVDVNAGYELVKRIKENVKSTNRPGRSAASGPLADSLTWAN